jgi:hypothetical protein
VVPRRRRGRSAPLGARTDATGDAGDFDPVEFAEFLEADEGPVQVDPAFRERLRHELWGMVRSQSERKRTAAAPVTPIAPPKRPG